MISHWTSWRILPATLSINKFRIVLLLSVPVIYQINIVIVDIFSQSPRWIALQRDDLKLASYACHQRLIEGVSGSLSDIF